MLKSLAAACTDAQQHGKITMPVPGLLVAACNRQAACPCIVLLSVQTLLLLMHHAIVALLQLLSWNHGRQPRCHLEAAGCHLSISSGTAAPSCSAAVEVQKEGGCCCQHDTSCPFMRGWALSPMVALLPVS